MWLQSSTRWFCELELPITDSEASGVPVVDEVGTAQEAVFLSESMKASCIELKVPIIHVPCIEETFGLVSIGPVGPTRQIQVKVK